MNRQLVTFCLLLISLNIQTQNLGTISGKVFNNENGLILEGATIQVEDSDFFAITNSEGLFEIKDIPFPYPYVIKPLSGGSSVDVHILEKEKDWSTKKISKTDLSVEFLVEPFIPGRELTVTIMDDRALAVTDILSETWYDYNAKYELGGSKHVLPAEIPNEISQLCLSYALKAHTILGCRGVSRVDFRWNEKLGSRGLFILELNTQPGMTPTSLVPEQAKYAGVSFEDLCEWLIEDASCDR